MTLLDANYFLRWFLNDVPAQNRQVVRFLERAPSESVELDRISLAEISYVLRGLGYNHQQIALALREFFRLDALKPLDKATGITLELYAKTTLDFEDCWLAGRAWQEAVELATFDKQLLKLTASLITSTD